MPYEVRQEGDQFCVYKKTGGKTLGCHPSRKEANDQIAAVYVNEKKMSEPYEILFGEPITEGEWIEASCTGDYVDKNGRPVSITESDLEGWVEAFNSNLRGQDLPITIDHPNSGGEAAGWFRGLKIGPRRQIMGKERTVLMLKPEWTPLGTEKVKNKEFQYVSVEILPENYLRAASLVNFPAVKGLKPVSQTALGDIGECFLLEEYVEMADKKPLECPECGAPVAEGDNTCPTCGADLTQTPPEPQGTPGEKVKPAEKKKGQKMSEKTEVTPREDTVQLEELKAEREQLAKQLSELVEARKTEETARKELAEQVKEQTRQIASLVDLNNMMRLHEKVTDFMQLAELGGKKVIAPAYEEPIINLMVLMEDTEQEQKFLDLLKAIAKGEALVEMGERGSGSVPELRADGKDLTEDGVHSRVNKYMAEHQGVSYKDALIEVAKEVRK